MGGRQQPAGHGQPGRPGPIFQCHAGLSGHRPGSRSPMPRKSPPPLSTTTITPRWHYEYKSQRTLFGLPLVHVRLGDRGFGVAKGIFAVGNVAVGLFALGGISLGLFSLGGAPWACCWPWADVRGRHRHWGLCGGTGRPGRRGHRPAVRGRRLLLAPTQWAAGRWAPRSPSAAPPPAPWPSGARPPPALSPSALGPTPPR